MDRSEVRSEAGGGTVYHGSQRRPTNPASDARVDCSRNPKPPLAQANWLETAQLETRAMAIRISRGGVARYFKTDQGRSSIIRGQAIRACRIAAMSSKSAQSIAGTAPGSALTVTPGRRRNPMKESPSRTAIRRGKSSSSLTKTTGASPIDLRMMTSRQPSGTMVSYPALRAVKDHFSRINRSTTQSLKLPIRKAGNTVRGLMREGAVHGDGPPMPI